MLLPHVSRRAFWLGIAWVFVLGACSPALPKVSSPTAPCTVAVSSQTAIAFLNRIQGLAQTKGNSVTITMTNQEVSSLLTVGIEQARQGSLAALVPIQDPIVCFTRGEMSLFGGIKPDGNNAISALFVLDAGISNGKASFKVKRAEVGPFSVPQDLGDTLSAWVSTTLNDNLGQLQLVQITFEQGQMRLTGKFQ